MANSTGGVGSNVGAGPLTNNSQAITEMEFYSNVNHLGLSVTHPHGGCFNNQSNDVFSAYSAEPNVMTSISQNHTGLDEFGNNPGVYSNNNTFNNDHMFLRHTIR